MLIVGRMPQAGLDVLKKRDDVDFEILADDTVPSLHPKLKDANAVTLGGTPFRQAELDAAPDMMVVARLGVGFDAVEMPALNKRKIPLMTTGIANSVSVAEHAMYMLLAAARLTKKSDRWVRDRRLGRASQRPAVRRRGQEGPGGRHGPHRLAHGEALRRLRDGDLCARSEHVRRPTSRKPAPPRSPTSRRFCRKVDFVSIHCPKAPETINMFNAETLGADEAHAFLVNTARGGIVNEDALYKALTTGKLRGAGLDVLDKEPPDPNNKLFELENVFFSPHMAGVTQEASDRMAVTAIENILSVFDGRPNAAHCVNKEVLG